MQSIFVSSTFQDMHQERDLLHNKVLPEIKGFARTYGQTVTFQDLRWGVDTKELDSFGSMMKVLQVCFDEIDAAKPFFIVFLGERYGRIPHEELVQFALNQQQRTIHSFRKKSITELEILYGALESEEPVECLFYFRTIDNLPAMKRSSPESYQIYAASNIQDYLRISSLKKRIKHKFPERIREYHVNWDFDANCFDGLQELADMVKRDVLSLLTQRFGPQRMLSLQEQQERQFRYNFENDAIDFLPEHSGFQTQLLFDLIQRRTPENIRSVWVNARDQRALDVCAASAALYAEQNGWDVIIYDCGDTLVSSDTQKMLVYLCQKLSKRQELDAAERAEERFSETVKQFRFLLDLYAQRCKTDLLIVLRGLDKMNEENWQSWFPEKPLRNICFLISGVDADVSADFNRNNPSVVWELRADHYVRLFLSKHGKQVDEEVMDALLRRTKDMPVRYIESVLSHLLNLGIEDYQAIRQNGDGIDAISAYLRQMIKQQPKSLHEQTKQMIAKVGRELGSRWTQDVLSILAAIPNSISLFHMERLMRFGGQSWSQLQLTWMVRQLSFLLSDTLDGYIRLSCDEARQDLQNILLISTAKWQDVIFRYMETVSPDDEFYSRQYLLLAYTRGDHRALWNYLERCGEDDLFLNLSYLLHRRNGAAWLVRSLEQISDDPALMEKHLLWCARMLYPWLKEHELCTEEFLLAWTSLTGTAQERYQREISHAGNECLFHFLFLSGEQNWKLRRTEEAEEALEQAVAIAEEDMRRWPNHIYRMLHGIRQDSEDSETYGLVYGDEFTDAMTGRSYSGYVRIAFQYLRELYSAHGKQEKAALAKDECDKYTQLADPNPTDEQRKTIAPGITMIMPDALTGGDERPAEKKHYSYRPDLRRNTAIRQAREATDCLKRKEFQKALELYRASNEMLVQIYQDGQTGELYKIDGDSTEREELVRRISSECLRDLGLNYDGIVKCCYALEMFEECRAGIRQGLAYCREFDRIRNSKESKDDLVNYLFVAVHYYHYMNDTKEVYGSVCELLNACCEAVRKTERFDSERHEMFSFARDVILDSIEAMPQNGTDTFALLLRLTNDSMRGRDYNSYIQLAVLCRDLLLLMLDQGKNWKTEEWTAEFITTSVMLSVSQLFRQRGMTKALFDITDCLEDLSGRLKDEDAKRNCVEMLTLVGFQHFSDGEYKQAAHLFQLELQMVKTLPHKKYLPINVLQDYSRLLPALSESGQYEKANQTGREALSLARQIQNIGYGDAEKAFGVTTEEFQKALISAFAEIHLNLGINYSRLGNLDAMASCFEASKRYALQIKNEPNAQQILKRITSLQGSDLSKHQDKEEETHIRKILSEIDQLLDEVKGKTPEQVRLREIGDQMYKLLRQLELIDATSYMLGATNMAWYYQWCGRIYLGIGMQAEAKAATLKAKDHIEHTEEPREFFAEIYTNLSALTVDEREQMRFGKSAIKILEELQKTHQLRSEHSLAMAYFNYGVMLYNAIRKRNLHLLEECAESPRTCPEYAEKACAIWRKLVNHSEQSFIQYLAESEHLAKALRELLSHNDQQ